jgi:hypothetical protein
VWIQIRFVRVERGGGSCFGRQCVAGWVYRGKGMVLVGVGLVFGAEVAAEAVVVGAVVLQLV